MLDQWEYRVLLRSTWRNVLYDIASKTKVGVFSPELLNRLGAEGRELCSASESDATYIFKRRLPASTSGPACDETG